MLSNQLINDFANALVIKKEKPTEYTYYGVKDEHGVVFDGATSATPCVSLVESQAGDRVMVTIKDHTAYISGIIDRPIRDEETDSE